MTNTTATTIRGDINIKVEEAAGADTLFIGAKVLPMLPVAKQSGTYPKLEIGPANLLTAGASEARKPKSSYPRISGEWTTDTFDCVERGLEEPVDDTEAAYLGDFFDAEVSAARRVLRSISLDYEIRVAAQILSTGNFGTATNSLVVYSEANKGTVNFQGDIINAIELGTTYGENYNTIVMSSTIMNRLAGTTLLQNLARGKRATDASLVINSQTVVDIFRDNGITNCFVGAAAYNSAKKGLTVSTTKVWGTAYIWVGRVESGPIDNGGAGRSFVWNTGGSLFVTSTYRDEPIKSNIVRVEQNIIEKITNGKAGTLVATQWG